MTHPIHLTARLCGLFDSMLAAGHDTLVMEVDVAADLAHLRTAGATSVPAAPVPIAGQALGDDLLQTVFYYCDVSPATYPRSGETAIGRISGRNDPAGGIFDHVLPVGVTATVTWDIQALWRRMSVTLAGNRHVHTPSVSRFALVAP